MEKTLPMKYPVITSLPKHANMNSVLSNYDCYDDWFHTNHIQVIGLHGLTDVYNDFYQPLSRKYFPFFEQQHVQKAFVDKWIGGELASFIMDSIDNGYY